MQKLLIVDDEQDITEFAKSFFKKRGINVFTASGGKTALAIINSENPDLVLLDVQMEEMTGIDVLKTLREAGKETKVIMVTGAEEESTVVKAKEYGVKEYIHKPLVLEELEKIVMMELGVA